MDQSRIWVGSEHSVGMDTQQNRKYHTTSKVSVSSALDRLPEVNVEGEVGGLEGVSPSLQRVVSDRLID